MRATLPFEVERFLRRHGPSTASGVALGVRARRDDVDAVLVSGRFRRAVRPDGAPPRAVYFDVSRRVLRADGSLPVRAQKMLDVLRDGLEHRRSEILAAGVGNPNNAASELRGAGYVVSYRWQGGSVLYRIDGFPADESPLEAA